MALATIKAKEKEMKEEKEAERQVRPNHPPLLCFLFFTNSSHDKQTNKNPYTMTRRLFTTNLIPEVVCGSSAHANTTILYRDG